MSIVHPDEVITPGDPAGKPDKAWDEECPICGSHWAAGPEKQAWGYPATEEGGDRGSLHCWRCGYDPTAQVAAQAPEYVQYSDIQRQIGLAVERALDSQAQKFAETLAQRIGPGGMAALAAHQQGQTGFGPAADVPADVATTASQVAAEQQGQG